MQCQSIYPFNKDLLSTFPVPHSMVGAQWANTMTTSILDMDIKMDKDGKETQSWTYSVKVVQLDIIYFFFFISFNIVIKIVFFDLTINVLNNSSWPKMAKLLINKLALGFKGLINDFRGCSSQNAAYIGMINLSQKISGRRIKIGISFWGKAFPQNSS